MDLPAFGAIRQLIHVGTQLVYLSVFDEAFILSSISLTTGQCSWTWDPLRPTSFHIPCTAEFGRLDTSLHVWNWDISAKGESLSHTFLAVILGSTAHLVHLTDGTIWGTSPPNLRLNSPVVFGNKLMGADETRTKLTEYTLPSFAKSRTISFKAPILHMLRPAAHVLIMATSGILSQFYLNVHKWGVKYNLEGKASLSSVRIEKNLVLALNKHVLFILSLNGQLLGKVSAIHGHIRDFAVAATYEDGVDVVLVERMLAGEDGSEGGGSVKEGKRKEGGMKEGKRKWMARLAKINWESDSVRRAKSGGQCLIGVEARDRICPLDHFHGLITVPMKDTISSEQSIANSIVAFGPGYIRFLQFQDFTPV